MLKQRRNICLISFEKLRIQNNRCFFSAFVALPSQYATVSFNDYLCCSGDDDGGSSEWLLLPLVGFFFSHHIALPQLSERTHIIKELLHAFAITR